MRPKIKKKELYYLAIPGQIEKVVAYILKDFDTTPKEALEVFYASPTYKDLENPKTGFWKLSGKKLYEDFLKRTDKKEIKPRARI